jgi:hypothetical protein
MAIRAKDLDDGGRKKILRALMKGVSKEAKTPVVFEHRFHDTRQWRFDVAFPDLMVALEIEGGVWGGGRHIRPKGFLKDMEKYNEATLCGWKLLRTTWDKVLDGRVVPEVLRGLRGGK